MSCTTCFSDYLAKCNEAISVFARLEPNSAYLQYKWVITDKFDNKYEGNFVTDADGFWEIPVSELPEGLLTQYSGNFKIEVFDAEDTPVRFLIAQEYDCIDFEIKGGTLVKDQIGIEF